MINSEQLRKHIIRPSLQYLDPVIPYSLAAENLLLGTCSQESGMGHYLVQIEGGPARGIFQMEMATHQDIYANYLNTRKEIKVFATNIGGSIHGFDKLVHDLKYATVMARIHYWRVRFPMPDTIEQQAHYWKLHWNTPEGAGTIDQYMTNYHRYVR